MTFKGKENKNLQLRNCEGNLGSLKGERKGGLGVLSNKVNCKKTDHELLGVQEYSMK